MAEINNNRPLTEEERKNGFNSGSVNMDLLYPLLMAVFSGNKTDIPLEKEVSYLAGKVDTLEKMLISADKNKYNEDIN